VIRVLVYTVVTVKLGLVSCLDLMCHLTRKLSSRFCGSGLVVGVPPTSIVQGISGCPS
jgi:hypothetical protein